ncbi:MAG: MG2 domain-containing protein, partial [Thermoguttaceae bacterium]
MRRMNIQAATWRLFLVACAMIIAWTAGLGQGSVAAQERVMDRNRIVSEKTQEIPLVGIAALPGEEANKLMEGKTPDDLLTCVERLDAERLYKDSIVVLKRVVDAGWIDDDSFAAQVKRAPNPEDAYSRAMRRLVNAYLRTNDFASVDALLEDQAKLHATSWRTLALVADLYAQTPRELYRVSDNLQFEFVNGAETVSRAERLRTRRLQLYNEARKLARDYAGSSKNIDALLSSLYYAFVNTLKENRPGFFKYELLTDLTTLPEIEPISYSGWTSQQGAPVDENGDPIFYHAPKSFDEAANDGERIQALYNELCEVVPSQRAAVLKTRAYEARASYGVTTLASYNVWRNLDDEQKRAAALASLEELADNETVARLANGVRSFTLPEDYAYIDLFREARDESEKTGNFDDSIYLALAQEFEMRGQLERAADVLRDEIDTLKRKAERLKLDSYAPEIMKRAQAYLSQIVDPRAAFDDSSQVLGEKAKLVLRSRNSKSVKVVVRRLDVDAIFDRLLTEESEKWLNYSVDGLFNEFIRAISLGKPQNDQEKRFIADVDPPKKFIGKEVASLNVATENAPGHKDSLTEFEIPNLAPGAYLVEALSKNGKEETKDSAVIWTRSATMARRLQKMEDGSNSATLYFMNTENGKPLSNTKLEITSLNWNGEERRVVRCVNDKTTDEKGAVDVKFFENNGRFFPRLTVVKKVDAKGNKELCAFSNYLGFSRLRPESETFAEKGLVITDRPIYRPKQRANFKTWIGYARYDKDGFDNFCADETVAYIIYSPTGEIVAKKTDVKLDQYGGFSDFFEIPESAQLGSYRICVGSEFNEDDDTPALGRTYASGYFRLEEYRKPEFKVSVEAPTEPVALGDKFKATIRADYYFGAPVANGKVKYTVTRSTLDARWSPPRYWDWFYGPGYWRMSYDSPWYPGWNRWGDCVVPPRRFGASEVVLSGEGELNEEGVLELEIDSSTAKKLYPSEDQSYSISAEVVDDSRRMESGSGTVKAARKPFSVVAWFDKGFYRQGETMTASFQTRRVDGKPVLGKVVVKLYAIAYDGVDEEGIAKATETEVFCEETSANETGAGSLKIAAPKPGQYRLSCTATTDEGLTEEGGRLIVVSGSDSAAVGEVGSCRFNALEIISDKPEYAPGDTARIQISSSKPDASVYFFTRFGMDVESSVPQLITLQNGVAYVDVKIEERDQPNFFVDAMTVFEGSLYQETRQICVPPVKRVLDVEVLPAQERVKPGEKLKIKLRLTDPNGKPVVGQTVATVYDASLEAISGGPNVGDIRKYFWDWKRYPYNGFESTILTSVYSNVFSERSPRVSFEERLRILGNFFNNSRGAFVTAQAGGMGGGLAVAKSYKARSIAVRDEIVVEDAAVMFDSKPMNAPAPMAASAPMAMAKRSSASFMMAKEADANDAAILEETGFGAGSASEPTEELAEATVRKNLADLAYWAADLTPADDGTIEIEIDVPENLTTWNVYAWSVAPGLRVGSGKSSFITTKDVIVRMEKPRFLTRGDEALLSAVVHNYSDSAKSATVSLSFPEEEGKEGVLELLDPQEVKVDVPVDGVQRVDWRVKATKVGEINLLMKALATGESDAIQESLTINEHGIDKQIAFSGMRTRKPGEDENFVREITTTIDVPAERREDSASLTLRYSPTLAGAILDAIPYLSDYPYGCVEQTLNRFLPAAIARKTLSDLGLDLETIEAKKTNLNAQELGDAATRAQQWKRATKRNPVFDSEEMNR